MSVAEPLTLGRCTLNASLENLRPRRTRPSRIPRIRPRFEDPTEVDQKVGLSRNRLGSLTDKRTLPVAQAHELQIPNEKRPRKAEPSSPFGAGNEIRTHDFNLGKVELSPGRLLSLARALRDQADALELLALELTTPTASATAGSGFFTH
jgi:hypothetical protein